MTGRELDTPDISLECRQPDPTACYERLAADEQPESCLRCPVASFNAALVFSGTWTDDLEQPDTLERTGKTIACIEEATTLRFKAA